MTGKFETRAQVEEYISGDTLKCLECGKHFQHLGPHLTRTHGMAADDYRERWGIPAMTPLAGRAYREFHRQKILALQASGALTYDHLPRATEKARGKGGGKIGVAKSEHSALTAKIRPGDHSKLPPGSKRADGRDADTARAAQARRRKAERA